MEIIGYLISNLFRVYLVYKFFRVFFSECRVSKQWELLVYGMYYCVNSCVYLIICTPVVTLIANIICMVIISCIYVATVKQRFFSVVLQYALVICAEMVMTYVMVDVFPVAIEKNLPNLTVVEYVTINLSSYPIILGIEKLKKVRQGEEVPFLYWVLLLFLPISSIYIALLLCMSQPQFRILASLGAICLLGINLIAFSLYDMLSQVMKNRLEELKIQEQNHSYEKQMQIYRESIEKTSTMRHDWKNHLAAIFNMAKNNHDHEIEKYVSDLLNILDNGKIYSKSGNMAVDAIVNYKCEEAEKCGISVKVEIEISKDIVWNEVDLSTIIGNLMDNAIRAAKVIKNNSYIHLLIIEQKGNLIIRISNPYSGSLKIHDGIYETTKQNKEEHGIGLKHIKKLVNKYHGVFNIDTQKQVFSVEVILFE